MPVPDPYDTGGYGSFPQGNPGPDPGTDTGVPDWLKQRFRMLGGPPGTTLNTTPLPPPRPRAPPLNPNLQMLGSPQGASIPPDVQAYMQSHPAYSEGERQGPRPNIAGGEPYSPTPQIDDIYRLFGHRIQQNSPMSAPPPMSAELLRKLMQLPGFGGFSGPSTSI